jgi:MFS family permease
VSTEPFSLRRIALPAFGPSFLFGLSEGAILPVIPLSVRELGGSLALAAMIVTLLGIGSLLSNLPASVITARWGERPAIIGAALWSAVGMLLCVLSSGLYMFALGTLMIGMSAAVFNLARQSYLTEAVPMYFRARALSTLGGASRSGRFTGPFLAAGLIHFTGIAGAYWIGFASLLLTAAVAAQMADLPKHGLAQAGNRAAPTLRSVAVGHWRVFASVGIGVLLMGAVRASRQVIIPLWAQHIGLEAAATSLIYGVSGAIDTLVFYPAGKVMDHKGRRWVAVPSMLFMGVAMLWMPFTAGATTLLLAAMLTGFGNGIGSGVLMTLGADYSPAHGRPQFLAIWRALSDVGSIGGPALLSAVTAAVSLAGGIVATSLLAFVGGAALWYWIPRTARPAG